MKELVTKKDLKDAINYHLSESEKAEEYADMIMDYFGFENRKLDNNLDFETRKILYDMSDFGLFYKEKETNKLYNGKKWMTFYWGMCDQKIFKSAKKYREGFLESPSEKSKEYNVYENLDDAIWMSRKTPSVG